MRKLEAIAIENAVEGCVHETFGAAVAMVQGEIHGIVIVGAMIVLGVDHKDTFTWVIGFVAVVLASANVVGGFVVTDRMLEMFKKREPPKPDEK